MECTSKEWDNFRVEKMGCYYNDDLEVSKQRLNKFINKVNKIEDTDKEWAGYTNDELHELKRCVETTLRALENSIPKKKIEDKISQLESTKFGRCVDTIEILEELLEE